MAHVVLDAGLAEAGLEDRVRVASSGTAGWHAGESMDHRAAAALMNGGYDPTRHRAQQYDASWADSYDLVLAMDAENLAELGGRTERVGMFRDLDPLDPGADVPDPWYGGSEGFAEVLSMIERTSDALVAELSALLEG
jgi:protein-tyrosine phosphatase